MSAPRDSGDRRVYLFMHLPKTGGTTVNAHFAEHLGFDDRFAHIGPWGDRIRAAEGSPQPHDWPRERLQRLRVISGHRLHATTHTLFEDREPRYFAFFRNPASLAVSLYNHDASRSESPQGFMDWYDERPANPQLQWCRERLGATRMSEVIPILDGFWFVGVTERLDRDLPHIFREIGVPTEWRNRRVAGGGSDLADVDPPIVDVEIKVKQPLTDDITRAVSEKDQKDRRLHDYATERAQQLAEAYDWL